MANNHLRLGLRRVGPPHARRRIKTLIHRTRSHSLPISIRKPLSIQVRARLLALLHLWQRVHRQLRTQ